jgi:hypothetical protein
VRQAGVEKQREVVSALLRNPELRAGRIKADVITRGITIEESTVEHLRRIVALVLEEQARLR